MTGRYVMVRNYPERHPSASREVRAQIFRANSRANNRLPMLRNNPKIGTPLYESVNGKVKKHNYYSGLKLQERN